MKRYNCLVLIFVAGLLASACGPGETDREETSVAELEHEAALSEIDPADEIFGVYEQWTGDFDEMLQRRKIRALVVYSKSLYFVDRAERRGLSFEALKAFESELNKKFRKEAPTISIIFVPVTRDQLLPALLDGRGDIAVANLTITPERLQQVDFSIPVMSNVSELIVTGPTAPAVDSLDDLSGVEIHVRASSSYYESLERLNVKLQQNGKAPVKIRLADEYLEDEDLLEMVNAGLIPMIVIDSHKGTFWQQFFENLTLRDDLALNTGAEIGWAFRKDSPKLREVVNAIIKDHRAGTLFGNVLLNKYLQNTEWVTNSGTDEELQKFKRTIGLFQKYAGQYGFDWLIIAAQAYQESRLDQGKKSPAGAVGIMQIKPSTARDPNVNVPNIDKIENNIHAGVKYLRFLADRYFSDAGIDTLNNVLLAFASYNAGPAKIARLRREAAQKHLDPNKWFGNVELIAARRIGRETVQYVSNIYKYYLSYRLLLENIEKRRELLTQHEL